MGFLYIKMEHINKIKEDSKMTKDWTVEVDELMEVVKKMDEGDAYQYLWDLYREGKISKNAHDWVVMWL